MPITAEQRATRARYLGSSDAPAVLGVDPWRSAADVYMEKVYGVEEARGEALDRGNDFESGLVAWAARQLGREIAEEQPEYVDGILICHPDAILAGERREGVEAKTTSLPKEYGAEGTDQVPERVIVQAHVQMHCARLEVVWVPVLLAEFDRLARRLYRVERNDDLVRAVVDGCSLFWRDHVEAKVPPVGSLPSPEVLKRVRREPESWAAVDPDLVSRYEAAHESLKAAEFDKGNAWSELVAAAGDAEGIDYGDPEYVYTYRKQNRNGIDAKALRRDQPRIAEKYSTCSTFRALRRVKR